MGEWNEKWIGVTHDLSTEIIIEQARLPDTSYPHKSECAQILADRIETLLTDGRRKDKVIEAARKVVPLLAGPLQNGSIHPWPEDVALKAAIREYDAAQDGQSSDNE